MLIRWLVALFGIALAVVLGATTYVIASETIPARLIPLSFVVSNYGLYLIPAGLLGVGIGLILLQRRHRAVYRLMGALVTLVCVIATAAAVVPLVASVREANRQGAALSVLGYVTGGLNSGSPVEEASVTYATVEGTDLRLDVKLPGGTPERGRAAVVWVHGGGFTSGDRGEAPKWHKWLYDRGYAVFAIDYRLAPPPRWDQAPADVRCAVGWVHRHAREYGVDPTRVMVAGGSAGGNLALMAAYAGDVLRPSCPVEDTSVSAVAAFYPPSDLAAGWEDSGNPEYSHRVLADYLGGSPTEQPDRYAFASPITHVRPGLPPTLLMHGTRDHTVPYGQSVELANRLDAAGVARVLAPMPYADHAYDLTWGDWATQISRESFADFLFRYFPTP